MPFTTVPNPNTTLIPILISSYTVLVQTTLSLSVYGSFPFMNKKTNRALRVAEVRDCADMGSMAPNAGKLRPDIRDASTKRSRSTVPRVPPASCNMPTNATVISCGRRHRNHYEV